MATWIKHTGEEVEVNPENGTDFSLEELQWFVCGFIEIINLGNKLMVVNEEGAFYMANDPNDKASLLAGQKIFGDVLVCKKNEIE